MLSTPPGKKFTTLSEKEKADVILASPFRKYFIFGRF